MSEEKIFGLKAVVVFWILFAVMIIPSAFFIGNSFYELDEILEKINDPPALFTEKILDKELNKADIDVFNAQAIIALELDVMKVRHHRSIAFIATRTWMRFMTIIFGSILVVIGAAFVLGKISGSETNIDAGGKDMKLALKSSSPGIILVFFGVILIGIPHFSKQQIATSDASSFVGKAPISSGSGLNTEISAEENEELNKLRKKHGIKEVK